MDAQLDGQTAVVIGGTTGIGRAISETLFNAGATVVPTSRSEKNVVDTARKVDCELVQTTDVSKQTQVEALFNQVAETYDDFNILVNCAGYVQNSKPLPEVSDDEWNTTIDVNMSGVFYASKLAPSYFAGDSKSIVNVGSVSEEVVMEGLGPYAASKAAVQTLGEYLAVEYANQGIRVNTVAPGYVKTRQNRDTLENEKVRETLHRETPLSRYAKAEEVANAVLFLASPAASFITGETIKIDGGFSL
jgi:NAD(P)-dependent dehydrogenase (short-subunit alcohol dehydrogenase family)